MTNPPNVAPDFTLLRQWFAQLTMRHNVTASAAPTATDDSTQGYEPGS